MARLRPYFFKSHGKPRVDDRRVLSSIVFVNCNGPRWYDAPRAYDPYKTLYNRRKRWGERGVFLHMMEGLSAADLVPETVMTDVTYLKAHRTALSLRIKKASRPPDRPYNRRYEHQAARRQRCGRAALELLHDHRAGVSDYTGGGPARQPPEDAVAAGNRSYDSDWFKDAFVNRR